MKFALAIFFCLSGLLWGQDSPLTGQRASTQNEELVVHRGSSKLRAVIVQEGEDLLRSMATIAGEPKGKPYPVVLEIHPAKEEAPSRIVRSFRTLPENENRYRLQVDLRLGAGESFDQENLRLVLLEMFIIERGLKSLPDGERATQVGVPAWLLYGLMASLEWDDGKMDRRVYGSLLKSGGWMEVEKLVDQKEVEKMDRLSRDLYRASTCALVRAFLKQPKGKDGMAQLVSVVGTFEGEQISLIQNHFSEVNLSRKGLERMWMLQVAAMAQSRLANAMTIAETEAELKRGLYLLIPRGGETEKSPGLDEWAEVLDLEDAARREAVRASSDQLVQLSYRSFPTYRQVIAGYLQLLAELGAGKVKDVDETLASMQTFREAESERYQQLLDLMDWLHLSTVKEESGEFEEYLKLKKSLEESPKIKGDPIHEYMDRAQNLFEKPKPKNSR